MGWSECGGGGKRVLTVEKRFSIISPHVHFTPRSFHSIFKLSNASQINDYWHQISILALIEKRLESNYQLDQQTMVAKWTTKSEPKSFTYRNCNISEKGAEVNFFLSIKIYYCGCCESSESFLFRFSTAKKFLWPEIDNQIKTNSKTVGIKVELVIG